MSNIFTMSGYDAIMTLCDIADALDKVAADSATVDALRAVSEMKADGGTVAQTYGRLFALIAPVIQKHPEELWRIVSAIVGKSVEEAKGQQLAATIADIRGAINDVKNIDGREAAANA